MPQPSDEDLVERAKQEDRAAFEVLVNRHKRMVFNIAWRMLRSRQDAEDAAQEAFLRAFRSVSTFRGEAKFSSWLYQIAVNVCLGTLEASHARQTFVELDDETDTAGPYLAHADVSPEEIVARKDLAERVRSQVQDLPPKYRAVLTLYYLEDRSYRETAQILGIPLGSVKVHLHRAKRILARNVLEQYDREEL